MMQREDGKPGDACHVVDGSTLAIDRGYPPVCVLPGYAMHYLTSLTGPGQRSLVQSFQPDNVDQIETIPGIRDMIAKLR
jgi:5-deoxy-glucuronate isomerase